MPNDALPLTREPTESMLRAAVADAGYDWMSEQGQNIAMCAESAWLAMERVRVPDESVEVVRLQVLQALCRLQGRPPQESGALISPGLMAETIGALEAALPLLWPAGRQTSSDSHDWIGKVIREVCELPDRSSPDDWPEAMLVTGDELATILREHGHSAAQPADQQPYGWHRIDSEGPGSLDPFFVLGPTEPRLMHGGKYRPLYAHPPAPAQDAAEQFDVSLTRTSDSPGASNDGKEADHGPR